MRKKIVSIILALLLIVTAIPVYADESFSSENALLTNLEVSAPDGTAVFYEEGEKGNFYLRQASDTDTLWSEEMPIGFSEQIHNYFVLCNNSTTGQILISVQVPDGVNAKYKIGDNDEQEIEVSESGVGQFAITAAEKKTSESNPDLIGQKTCKVVVTVSKDDISQTYKLNFYRKGAAAKIAGLKIDDKTPAGYSEKTTTELNVGVGETFSLSLGKYVGPTHKVTIYKDSDQGKSFYDEKIFSVKDTSWEINNLRPGKYYIKYSNIQKKLVQYTHTLILNSTDQTPKKVDFMIKDKLTEAELSDAEITVFDNDGTALTPDEDGYNLSPGGYTYVVKKKGYFTEHGSFLVEVTAKTVTVSLTACDTTNPSNVIENIYGEYYPAGTLSNGGKWSAERYKNTDIYIATIEKTSTSGIDYTLNGVLASPTATISIIDSNGKKYPVTYSAENGRRTISTKVAFFAVGAQHFTLTLSDDGIENKTYDLIINMKLRNTSFLSGLMLRSAQDNNLLGTDNQPTEVFSGSSFVKSAAVDINNIVLQLKRNGSEPNFSLLWKLGTWFSNDENWVRINGGKWTRASASSGISASSTVLELNSGINIVDIKSEAPEIPFITKEYDGYKNVGYPKNNAREIETEYTTLIIDNEGKNTNSDNEIVPMPTIQSVEAKQWIVKQNIELNEFPVVKETGEYSVFIPESMVYPYIVLTVYPKNPSDEIKVDNVLGERIGYNFVVPVKNKDSVNVTLSSDTGVSTNYTIKLIRKSNAAFIETLTIENGKLTKAFEKDQLNYTIEATDWNTGKITLTPMFSEGATVKVNGVDFKGESISIDKNTKKTIIEVTAADTVTKKKYIFLQGDTSISETTKKRASSILEKGWLKDHTTTEGKYYGNYWGVFQAAATGIDLHNSTFEVKKLEDCKQATDYGATILQLILMGENPYDYKGMNYVEALAKDDTHVYANDIFRLLAFTAAGYDYDEDLVKTITKMAKSKTFDLDMKSWALIALSSIYDKAELTGIAETFKNNLQSAGIDTGMFVGDYGANANTQGCVLSALVSAGIDVGSDEWSSNGVDPLGVMEKYYVREDGKIYYINPENMPDYWTSIQCDYNKDFIIALGDIVQGSSVWQREALTRDKFNMLLAEAEKMIAGSEGTEKERSYVEKKYANAKAAAEGKDKTVIKGLGQVYYELYDAMSCIDSSMKMADPSAVKVKSLSINGIAKTDYKLGEPFDPQEISFTATFDDGTTKKLSYDQVNLIGFNTTTSGKKPIRFEYRGVYTDVIYITVSGNTSSENTNTVSVTVKDPTGKTYCDRSLIVIEDDETAYSVLTKTGLNISCKSTQYGLYVDGIEGLYEFDKGSGSGWMYRVNGIFPNYSAAQYKLKNSDNVEWLYTQNYGLDIGAGHGYTPETDVKEVITIGNLGSAITSAPTEVSVIEKVNDDGTKEKLAQITVSSDIQQEILKQAKENQSAEIVLNVNNNAVKNATKAEIRLDKNFIDSIVKETKSKLTIKTPFGDKTYTQDELKSLSAAASSSTITLAIEKTDVPTENIDEKEKIEKAKKLTASMNLTVRSARTVKKNIKVTVKTNRKTTASIKELKALGYTVKYRYYRSIKKGTSYKSSVTKFTKTYINTVGKKGKMYYYKAQARVYDQNGKLIAKTSLKQCKYANRVWNK